MGQLQAKNHLSYTPVNTVQYAVNLHRWQGTQLTHIQPCVPQGPQTLQQNCSPGAWSPASAGIKLSQVQNVLKSRWTTSTAHLLSRGLVTSSQKAVRLLKCDLLLENLCWLPPSSFSSSIHLEMLKEEWLLLWSRPVHTLNEPLTPDIESFPSHEGQTLLFPACLYWEPSIHSPPNTWATFLLIYCNGIIVLSPLADFILKKAVPIPHLT